LFPKIKFHVFSPSLESEEILVMSQETQWAGRSNEIISSGWEMFGEDLPDLKFLLLVFKV